mgnify:CR=1 FL=1
MYFKKLDITFDIPDFDTGDLVVEYGLDIGGNFHGLWYNEILNENQCPLKNVIPQELQDSFVIQLMQANTYIHPHTDSGTLAVVNFYLSTNGCVTQFHEIKEGARPFKLPSQTDGCIYSEDDLELGPSFLAEPGDVYLLDVTKVHSVVPPAGVQVDRKALCLASTSLNFEQVKQLV